MTGEDRAELRLWHDTYSGRLAIADLLVAAAWAVDYLGADVDCVVELLWQRAEAFKDWVRQPGKHGSAEPNHIRESYGWHNCPTVIGLLTSDTDIAEHCRVWLPEDVELERRVASGPPPVYEIFDGCDDWAAWVVRYGMKEHSPRCGAAMEFAEEWLEHHREFPPVHIGC